MLNSFRVLCRQKSGQCAYKVHTWDANLRGADEQRPWEPLLLSLFPLSHPFSPSRFLLPFMLCFPQSAWNVTTGEHTEAVQRNSHNTAWAAGWAAQVSSGTSERLFPSPEWKLKHTATNQKSGLWLPRRNNLKSTAQQDRSYSGWQLCENTGSGASVVMAVQCHLHLGIGTALQDH